MPQGEITIEAAPASSFNGLGAPTTAGTLAQQSIATDMHICGKCAYAPMQPVAVNVGAPKLCTPTLSPHCGC